jgi:CheY-like chemotaxis protein
MVSRNCIRPTLSSLADCLLTPSLAIRAVEGFAALLLGKPEPAAKPILCGWERLRPWHVGPDWGDLFLSTPLRIFVVEDELLIRMLLEDMLTELGHTITAEAAKIDDALAAARTAAFDLAILDVNLNGQNTGPVADALAARGTPFVFATGYGPDSLPEQYRSRPTLKKPFQLDGLKQTIAAATAAN